MSIRKILNKKKLKKKTKLVRVSVENHKWLTRMRAKLEVKQGKPKTMNDVITTIRKEKP